MTDHSGHEHHVHQLSYADAVKEFRAEKDEWFGTNGGSPIPAAERATFSGLPYWPVDEDLVFDGLALEPYPDGGEAFFEIQTTDGRQRLAERAGRFHFSIDGADQVLTAYRVADATGVLQDGLFVPFLDATSGVETYGAGRYLDLEPDEDGTWTLDFNMAYHPSCVYDTRYSCPITPAENRLPVRVEAGERLTGEGH
jgi:uncharacterized protein (DUF1684 family)